MKSYNGFYESMLEHSEIVEAILEAASNKHERAVVQMALADLDRKADEEEKRIRSGKWKPPNHQRRKLEEGAHKKVRMIERPRWDDEQIVWACVLNGFAWIWCSYILAALDKAQIAETLSTAAVTEIIGAVLAYALKSLVENLSKNNHWPDKHPAETQAEPEADTTDGDAAG